MPNINAIDYDGKALENFFASMTKENIGIISCEETSRLFVCSLLERFARFRGAMLVSNVVYGLERDAHLENDRYSIFSWKFYVNGQETYFNLFAKKSHKDVYEQIEDEDIDILARMWCAPDSVSDHEVKGVLGLLDFLKKETGGIIADADGFEYSSAKDFWDAVA